MSEQNFIIKNGELKKYIGNSENVIIPEQITRIGSCAFEDNIYIKTVTFPETVKKSPLMHSKDAENLLN